MSEPMMSLEKAKEILSLPDDPWQPSIRERSFARGFIEGATSERQRMIEKFRPIVKALESVDSWFERMKKDQNEKLVVGQTFDSACENWDKLLNEPLDMEPIKKSIELFREIEKQG